MKKNRLILEACLSIALAAVIIILATISFSGKKKAYDVIVFGDSIIGNDRTENSVTAFLEKESGLKCLNAAFGGTCLTGMDSVTPGEKEGFYSVYEISEAFAAGDIERLTMAAFPEKLTARYYFEDTVKELGRVDIKKTKYIIIQAGTNDYLSGVIVKGEDKISFYESLRKTVENFKKAAPHAEIMILTPCFNDIFPGDERNSLNYSFDGGGTIEDYVNAELLYGKEYGIPVIDNLHGSKINENTYEQYLLDGLHPNTEGNREIAATIWNFIAQKTQ